MKNIVHWCKQKKMWTSHTYKSCTKSTTILVDGEWFVETKPNKKDNPRGWIVTDHKNVLINPSKDYLLLFEKKDRVFYDKENITFSQTEGKYILFDEEGCFMLEKRSEVVDYIVEVIYGMESYQVDRKGFGYDEEDEARKYYEERLQENPLKISMYQLLMSNSIITI